MDMMRSAHQLLLCSRASHKKPLRSTRSMLGKLELVLPQDGQKRQKRL